jgi:replicative DNA helicase
MTQTLVPTSLDFDQEFINHCAVEDSVEFILREGFSPDLLVRPEAKSVYAFVQHQFSQTGKVPSIKTMQTEFPRLSFDAPDTTANYIVDKLRERFQRKEVADMLVEVAEVVEKDPTAAMNMLRSNVFDLEKKSQSSRHIWRPGDHMLFLANLKQKIASGFYQGASIGYDEIDRYTGGVKPGNCAYVMARPKLTKTFNCLNAFIAQAEGGWSPFLTTLENSEEEVMLRISCMLSGFPWDAAQKGQIMKNDWKLLENAWDKFSADNDFRIECPPLDERTVAHIVNKADREGAKSLIISQFKYIDGTQSFYRSEHEKHAEIAVDLKRAAARPGFERPIIVEAQFNRGGDNMEELEDFDASKVGLTDMIPQSADTIYGLFQNKDMRQNNTTEFGILLARNHGRAAWFVEQEFVQRTELRLQPGSQH